MFDRAEKMFDNFPEPLGNGFFQRTVQYKNTVPFFEECEDEAVNDPSEYKLVKTPTTFISKEDIEEWLNGFGAEGWDLNCFEFGYAIFSRYIEDEDEDEKEESGPEDV
jgi:hypothetical protein